MDFKKELENILKNDPLGLLVVKPTSSPITSNERLASSFEEINIFFEKNNREPTEGSDIIERK